MFDIIAIRDMQIQPQWDTTSHPLEWQARGHIITSINKDVENQNLSYIADGNIKYNHFGK